MFGTRDLPSFDIHTLGIKVHDAVHCLFPFAEIGGNDLGTDLAKDEGTAPDLG